MKIKFRYIFIFFILVFMPITALAKDINSNLILESTNVKKGESVEVKIKLDDRIDKNVHVFQAIFSFDESLFEGIDENSLTTHNGWIDCTYNKETHALILINKFGSSLGEEILSFKLKVKKQIQPTKTTIALKNVSVANKDEQMPVKDASVKINLTVPSGEIGNSKQEKEFYGKNLEGSTVKFYNMLMIIVLELIIATVLVMIYYASKLYITNPLHRKLVVTCLCLVEVFAIAAMFKYDIKRGDLNGDVEIDFKDVEILEEHLINSKMISPLKLANADMNNDGMITTLDLAILLDNIVSKMEYTAILTDSLMESNGYEKGSIIDLRFFADITDSLPIEYVLIGDKKYKVEQIKDSKNEYTVKLEASNVSKKHNFKVSEVILKTGQKIKVDYKTEVMVLKDAPKLSNFATYYNKEENKATVALTILDADDAIVNATYELVKNNGTLIDSGSLSKGKNSLTFNLENAVNYKFKIKINYNRGAESGAYVGSIEDAYDLKIITDYRLQIGNLALMQNGLVVTNLEKNTETLLTFNSQNATSYTPKKVMINGSYYPVSKVTTNKYKVVLPNDLIIQNNSLTISKVVLSNGKVILTNSKIAYNTLKKEPHVEDVYAIENISDSTMKVSVDIEDTDSTLSRTIVRLYDSKGDVISEELLPKGSKEMVLETRDTDKYTLRIFADYSLQEGNEAYTVKEKLLYEKEIPALLNVRLSQYTISEKYPDKRSTITLKYKITSNYRHNVQKVVVNSVIYDIAKTGLDEYELELNVEENSGIKEFNTTKLIFDDDKEYTLDEIVKCDVLKDKPFVDNFEIIENKQESTIDVSFDMFDKDNAFIKGKLNLVEINTGDIKASEDVILGKNSTKFVLENAIKYKVEVVIDANLDTGVLEENSSNKLENHVLKSVETRIITDYKFNMTNIDTFKENSTEPTKYFEKGDDIRLEFTSTNVTEFVPIKAKIDGVTYDVTTENGISKLVLKAPDVKGVKTIRFESIVLSNHVELEDSSSIKIEVLSSVPYVDHVDITELEDTLNITPNISDSDSVLANLKMIIEDSTGLELANMELNDETKTISMNKTSRKFTIKLIGSYDLDSNILEEDKNSHIEETLFAREFDLDENYLDISSIKSFEVDLKETHEKPDELTIEDLEHLELYEVKITFLDDTSKLYDIEKLKRIDDALMFVLKDDSWTRISPGKWQSAFTIEYGTVEEDKIVSKYDPPVTERIVIN